MLEAVVGDLALEQFPEERAKGEDIDLLVVLALLEQLGSHVAGRPCELHGTCAQVSDETGEAKIADLDVEVVVDENVVTLDVSVHDA